MAFGGIDDALDHITHARSPYSIDHIFRPQTWYLTDTHGHIGVDRLFMLDDMARIQDFIRHYTPTPIGHANAGEGQNDETPSADQIARIRQIYRQDYDLIATVRNNRTAMQPDRALQSRMDRAAFDLA